MDQPLVCQRPPTRRRPLEDASSRLNVPNHSELDKPRQIMMYPRPEQVPGTTTSHRALEAPISNRSSPIPQEQLDPNCDSFLSDASGYSRNRKTHIGPWQLGPTVGKGGTARVRKVRHMTTGQEAVAKIVSKEIAEKVRAISLMNLVKSSRNGDPALMTDSYIPVGLEREIVIMKLLNHRNIVKLYDVWENRNELYLVMEKVEGGELFEFIARRKCLDEGIAVYLYRQIVAALLYLHRIHIHHRDLKPENILIDVKTLTVKLVDFGMAALQPKGGLLTTPCGSPHYAAPELLNGTPYDGSKADVWSSGVVLFVMLTGKPPFNYPDDPFDQFSEQKKLTILFRNIHRADYKMPANFSPELQDLVRRIFIVEPPNRISVNQIWFHPWLQKYNKAHNIDAHKEIDRWIGPKPRISNWKAVTRKNIDREIFRNLRTLWHSETEKSLLDLLCSPEPNQQKFFYKALMGHREEHLEDFQPNPTAINYSSSDHQHMLPAPVSNALSSVQSELMHSKSEYSVAGNEQLYSRHSFFDLTPSEMSYDPYRDAHEAKPNYLEVAIKRSLSKDGRRVKPGHRSTLTRLEATRLEAARQSSRKSSRSYFTGTNSMRSSRAGRASHVSSRMSLTSSQAAGASHALVIRRQLSHRKRNVNFSHLRRGVTPDDATPAPTPSSGTSAIPGPNKVMPSHPRAIPAHSHRVDSPTPPHAPTGGAVRSLKEKLKGTTSAHRPTKPREFDSDARQASAEFGKVCEEAFFQSSFGSTATSNITEQRTARTDTPPSSLLRDSVNLSTGDLSSRVDKVVLRNRPLPPTPDYPRIQVTGEKGGTADGRRSVSAPQDRSYHKTVPDQDMNHLHIIPEEGRFADDENNTDYYNSPVYQRSPYRSVTDPQPYSQVYRPEATIRCVGASTPSPAGSFGAPSPLAIRKQKSNIGQERSPTPSADKPHPVSMVSDASDWQDCNSSGPSSAVDLTHPDGTRKGYPNHTFELSSVQRQRSVRKGAQARGGEAKKGFMNLFKRKKRTDAVISEVPSSPPSMVPSNSQVFVKPKDNTHWNALQRWLRIRPFTASTIIVSSRVNALNTVRMFLDEIRGPLGIQGISAEGWTVCANVPEDNEASAKPASFAIEIFEMQRNYRPIGVQLIRITQIRGAQSTVKIVVSKLGAFLRKFNLILDDKAEASRLIAAFNAPLEAVQEKLNQA